MGGAMQQMNPGCGREATVIGYGPMGYGQAGYGQPGAMAEQVLTNSPWEMAGQQGTKVLSLRESSRKLLREALSAGMRRENPAGSKNSV